MQEISDLKRDISQGLMNDLSKQMLTGETIVLSLPGSFGEALVVSDRRAIVVRERASSLVPMSDVYAYPLGRVTGAMAITSGAGGYIELRLDQPVADPDTARVYFPLTEEARFKAAAEYLSKPRAVEEPKPATDVCEPVAVASASKCPKCGCDVSGDAVYCRRCGVQLRVVCISCGESTPADSVFCEHCGRNILEFQTTCPKCSARIARWMSYCPDCGAIVHSVCVGCGAAVRPDWTYCAMCGRKLGSNRLDPRAAGSAARRMQQLQQNESAQDVEPTPTPSAPNTAEEHNKRGRELCEAENFDSAIAEFAAAVAIDPNNAAYHCNLAVAYDECDRDGEALAEYQRTLLLAPNDLTALLYLGYMYSENEQMDKAQDVWGQILRIAPESAEAQEVRQNLQHQGEL